MTERGRQAEGDAAAPDDPDALAQACAAAMWADDRASHGLGIRLDSVVPGRARLSMPVTERMVNGLGICHGGLIFTLADTAFAFACNTYGEQVVAQHCAVTFLRPVRLGTVLVAEAAERARAGRGGIYDVTVRAEDGTVVAEFRGHSRGTGRRFFDAGAAAKDASAADGPGTNGPGTNGLGTNGSGTNAPAKGGDRDD